MNCTPKHLPARFYPIAPDYITAEKYIIAGVKFLQIRLKELSESDIQYQLKNAVALAKKHDVQLVINDFWESAIALNADWIHLGQEDLHIADMEAIKKAGLKLGLSTHDNTELHIALRHNPDYIALGPVYFTKLKAMKWNPQGLDTVKHWKTLCNGVPLVAIGGITLEKATDVFNAGADCVSFVTDITHHETPDIRLRQWIEIFSS
jgi:thiamine-phosphate pyrophosphorylase